MYSINEWDILKKVVVGIANDAKIPPLDKSLRLINYADKDDSYVIPCGSYPQQVIDEANEDLEILVDFLKSENVEVLRPNKSEIPNYYNYCPRDTILSYSDKLVAPPMSLMSRRDEWKAYIECLETIHLMGHPLDNDKLYDENCIGNPNILALTNNEPCFDAANVLKSNDDLFYLI